MNSRKQNQALQGKKKKRNKKITGIFHKNTGGKNHCKSKNNCILVRNLKLAVLIGTKNISTPHTHIYQDGIYWWVLDANQDQTRYKLKLNNPQQSRSRKLGGKGNCC